MNNFVVDYQSVKSDIISCRNCKFFPHLFMYVNKKIHFCSCCKCKNFMFCLSVAEAEDEKKYIINYNSSVRYELNGDVELIVYNDDKKLSIKDKENLQNVRDFDNSRCFIFNNDVGSYEVVKPGFTYEKIYRSIKESRRRSIQNFYNIVLANKWEYFITLTFDSKYVDRYDDFAVKALWSKFLRYAKTLNPDFKCIVVPEYHDKVDNLGRRALHFHGFVSNVSNFTFLPCVDSSGNYIYTNFEIDGKKIPRLFLKDWIYGFSTVDFIVDCNNLRISNYCAKYLTKMDESLGYCKKRYYCTHNLDKCFSNILNLPRSNIVDVLNAYNLVEVKSTDNFKVYRTRVE